ncbi:MAG TPA: CapA family protein [Spirochaetota bacterium]|nr:CapA family protein [Spirochaetota bacterium]
MPKTTRTALAVLLIFVLLQSCRRAPEGLSVSFVGDIIMHIPVKSCARLNDIPSGNPGESANNGGFDYLFELIAPRLLTADITLGNLEFPVSAPFESRPYVFNCRPEVLGALKKAGISLVTIANNHILDQGIAGALETLEHLKRYGIRYVGGGPSMEEAAAGYVFQKNGIRVGLIACTGVVNTAFPRASSRFYLNNFYKKELMLEQIDAMKARADFIVMSVHAGAEYVTVPLAADAALMREYGEHGADLIIGHHPHVLQRVDRFTAADGRMYHIFHSLGNFISNQSSEHAIGAATALSTRDSAIVTLFLERHDRSIRPRFEIVPIRTVNEIVRHRSGRMFRSIRPVAIADEINALRAKTSAAIADDETARRLIVRMEVIKKALLSNRTIDTIHFADH